MAEKIYSVSGLTRKIRGVLEYEVGRVSVEGEISNHRAQASGHHYFTLKDSSSQLSCVLFRGQAKNSKIAPQNGIQVQAFGEISVYEARGSYQLIVKDLQLQGEGILQARYEALKRALFEEGLFDETRKKQIPSFPRTLVLVTSPSGAALQDMLHVLARRAPWLRVLVFPVAVQGDGASRQIVRAIEQTNRLSGNELPQIDVLIVTRGGGSLEDLWSFNEEAVARAIAASTIPVISGVGHEIDFTIADFSADLRAPTPSAAAELVAPDGNELRMRLGGLKRQIELRVDSHLDQLEEKIVRLGQSPILRDPERIVHDLEQDLDRAEERIVTRMGAALSARKEVLVSLAGRLAGQSPCLAMEGKEERLKLLASQFRSVVEGQLQRLDDRVEARASHLHSLGPFSVFERGFSMTTDNEGSPVTSIAEVEKGEKLVTRLGDGSIQSTVDSTAGEKADSSGVGKQQQQQQ